MENTVARNRDAVASPGKTTVGVNPIRAIVNCVDFGSAIDFKIFHEDGKSPSSILVRGHMRVVEDSQLAIIATEATFTIPAFVIVVYIDGGVIRHKDINGIGGDAIMITVCGYQSRMVRDINSTLVGCIFVILVRIRINIDAAATIFTSRTRIHKPADGEVRIILNVQVTAVVDAQTAAARLRLGVRDVHGLAFVQNQCAGAKEYRRDFGSFAIGVAGVRSRLDSQRRAVHDGHFAVGRIDALVIQRQAVLGGIQRDILPLGRSANFRPIKPQALVIQRQIILQGNNIAAFCLVDRLLQRRIPGIANLSHNRGSNTSICLSLVAIA